MKTIKETINEVMKEHYNSNDIQEFSLWVDSLINEADKDERESWRNDRRIKMQIDEGKEFIENIDKIELKGGIS